MKQNMMNLYKDNLEKITFWGNWYNNHENFYLEAKMNNTELITTLKGPDINQKLSFSNPEQNMDEIIKDIVEHYDLCMREIIR